MLEARWNRLEIPAGDTVIGSDEDYPEERPAHHRHVAAFTMDVTPVTVADFGAFVAATGYVTTAEQPSDLDSTGHGEPEGGSMVFTPTSGPVSLGDPSRWWTYVPGASWRRPGGPGTTARPNHPVVHVSFLDANVYAEWAGAALPTEEQWEHAARAAGASHYAWGGRHEPGGVRQANTWHGHFPWEDADPDGFRRTSPVGSYPANPWGLYDMIGNVWEWTCTVATVSHAARDAEVRVRPQGGGAWSTVIKGGSFLCSPDYCRRDRPAARGFEEIRSSSSQLGFRCVGPAYDG
ncbi:formylglycine-generating enzyme family protein [Gordonia sp. (in: high G+C Gram-positive bacteria)]|uniref:formylglycine-generating enzyme family protein n=1 Tax=Gordonia sp. (in: high G+C Gram-positive bacteria) TaxID=84139 RepID=UPI003F95A664